MDADDWTLLNVYLRPSERPDDKPYWPVRRRTEVEPDVVTDFREMFFMHWRKHGLSDEEIEKRYERWSSGGQS